MADPTTTNRSLAIPTRGSDVGTWDSPVNGNMAIIDTIVGGVTTITSGGGTIVLNASQVANGTISINGSLTSSLFIQFPAVQGWWSIENLTTGNTSFIVSIFPAGATESVCAPPGEIVDIQINGTVARYRNLGRVGSLMEWAGPTMPLWIAGCTKPPYLNCDGSTFSSGTYPRLAEFLGGTTLPDSRGRVRAALNQGTGRLTVIDGNTNFAAGGAEQITLTAGQLPSITSSGSNNISVNSTSANVWQGTSGGSLSQGGFVNQPGSITTLTSTGANTINVTSNNTSGQAHVNVQPTYVTGLTLIRAG